MARNDKPLKQAKQIQQPVATAVKQEPKPVAQRNSADADRVRGLIIVVGVAVLLVLALITLGFFIASIARNNNGNTQTTDSQPTNQSDDQAQDQDDQSDQSDQQDQSADTDQGDAADTADDQSGQSDSDSQQDTAADDAATADSDDDSTQDTSNPEVLSTATSGDNTKPASYTFTAGNGDSVSWLARRAMYAYMGDHGLGLSSAQRLYFEVTLSQQTGLESLNVGQTITFSASTLATVFQQASNLNASSVAAWQVQVDLVGYV